MGMEDLQGRRAGPNGSVLYVFVMDPTVKGADYGVAKILAEAYPTRDHGALPDVHAARLPRRDRR